MLEHIGIFKRYKKVPSALKYGYYYYAKMKLPFAKTKDRFVRVWLPEDYDFDNQDKRFPVIYFSDGQNLVDKYLSAYGEWELDKSAHNLLKQGYQSFIAVGIDCPKDPMERMNELNPPYPVDIKKEGPKHPYANKYVEFIKDELKPLIDSLFYTLIDKDNTGIGGSSMGGIMSFYAYLKEPETFGFSLSFSPAFFFYKEKHWYQILDEFDIENKDYGKIFLYSGGLKFEEIFLYPTVCTYNYLKKRLKPGNVEMIVDTRQKHHEKAWSKYLKDALKFWLKKE